MCVSEVWGSMIGKVSAQAEKSFCGPKRPHKHKDPRHRDFWNPPLNCPCNQNVGSSCFCNTIYHIPHTLYRILYTIYLVLTLRPVLYHILYTTDSIPYTICHIRALPFDFPASFLEASSSGNLNFPAPGAKWSFALGRAIAYGSNIEAEYGLQCILYMVYGI